MSIHELVTQETADRQTAEALEDAASLVRLFGYTGSALTGCVVGELVHVATATPSTGLIIGGVAASFVALTTLITTLVVENKRSRHIQAPKFSEATSQPS